MREKIDRLEIFVNNLKTTGTTSAPKPKRNDDCSEISSRRDLSPLLGDLRLSDTGSTRYVSPVHWESIIDDVSLLQCHFLPDRLCSPALRR